jgi:hypothetical protein
LGTSILLSLGLVFAVAVIALSAFIAYATLTRIVRDRLTPRTRRSGNTHPGADADEDENEIP